MAANKNKNILPFSEPYLKIIGYIIDIIIDTDKTQENKESNVSLMSVLPLMLAKIPDIKTPITDDIMVIIMDAIYLLLTIVFLIHGRDTAYAFHLLKSS